MHVHHVAKLEMLVKPVSQWPFDEIKTKLQADCIKAMQWFKNNNMKANADKFQLVLIN